MVKGHFFALLVLGLEVVAAGNECNKLPYNLFADLSTHSKALAFCTSKYPIPRPTCLATTVAVATITPPVVYVTVNPIMTTTVTPDCANLKKRTSPKPTPKPDPKEVLWSSLTQQASSFVETLCSCIETTPACSTKTLVVSSATILPTATSTITLPIILTEEAACPTPTPAPSPVGRPCTPSGKSCDPANYNNERTCACYQNTEGTGSTFLDANAAGNSAPGCPSSQACSSSHECGTGWICITNSCCGFNICAVGVVGVCGNSASPVRMFRRGGGRLTTRAGKGKLFNPPAPSSA